MASGSRQKKSLVWKYFDEKEGDNDKVVCRLCHCELVAKNTTGSMRNHLRGVHPVVSLEDENAPRKTQPSMAQFATPLRRRCDPARTEFVTNLIVNMIEEDLLPLSFTEGSGFRKLMAAIEPEYVVPGRKAVTARVERDHEEMVKKIKRELEGVSEVAITSDAWTSMTTESYTTITCHAIIEGEIRSYVLQTCALEERHTAENIAAHLKDAIAKWGLTNKVVACTHDNAANMVLANTRLLDWESVACFAHTLQCAINDGFKANDIARLIGACSKLVSHFHHSTVATVALKKKQEQLTPTEPPHKLIQSCKTRWNSVADMFERLHEQRWAISAVLSDRTVTNLSEARHLELVDDHWLTIECMLPVLQALRSATTALCGEEYVSASMMYPITMILLNR